MLGLCSNMKRLQDSIDHEPDYYVEAEPFDWDEAIEFHKALLEIKQRKRLKWKD